MVENKKIVVEWKCLPCTNWRQMREIEAWSAKNQSEVNRNLIGNVSWSKHGIREVRNFTFYYVKFQFLGNIQQLPSTHHLRPQKQCFFQHQSSKSRRRLFWHLTLFNHHPKNCLLLSLLLAHLHGWGKGANRGWKYQAKRRGYNIFMFFPI